MSNNRTARLIVELLEDRTLMSASGLIADADGPISTYKNTPITIDVLVNDINQHGDTLSIVNLTQDPKGIATVNPDNTVTFNPFMDMIGSVALGYVVTNGQETASANIYIDIFKSPSELYSDYQTTVAQADQAYAGQIADASSERLTTIITARAQAESTAVGLYANYQSQLAQANAAYVSAIANALAAYQGAVQSADNALNSSYAQAQSVYDTATASADNAFENASSAAHLTYLNVLAAADAAYALTVAPYQTSLDEASADAASTQSWLSSAEASLNAVIGSTTTSRDASEQLALAAYEAAQANSQEELDAAAQTYADALAAAQAMYVSTVAPFQVDRDQADTANQSAQIAVMSVQAALTNAQALASATKDQAYATALANYQGSQSQNEQTWGVAIDAAATTFRASAETAGAAWTSANTTAWGTYTGATNNAEASVIDAEATAWNNYTSGLSNLESNRTSAEASAQDQFNTRVSTAFSSWSTDETTAWTTYVTGMAGLPGALEFGQRINAPAPVEVAAVVPFLGFNPGAQQQPQMLAQPAGGANNVYAQAAPPLFRPSRQMPFESDEQYIQRELNRAIQAADAAQRMVDQGTNLLNASAPFLAAIIVSNPFHFSTSPDFVLLTSEMSRISAIREFWQNQVSTLDEHIMYLRGRRNSIRPLV